jgi:hypothetical protein
MAGVRVEPLTFDRMTQTAFLSRKDFLAVRNLRLVLGIHAP